MSYTINDLSAIAPILLREGIVALRENTIMASQCQFDVSEQAAKKGATIDVDIPSVVPAQEVNVETPNDPTLLVPTVVPVKLDQWFEAKFSMSDKDMTEVEGGILPASASEAVKSLANKVDISALGLSADIYGQYGTAGVTPGAVADVTGSRKVLNAQLAPLGDRTLLLDVEAEAKFLGLPAFSSLEQVGDTAALQEGSLGRKFGFDIHMDQNMPYHTKGTLAASQDDIAAKAIYAIGLKTVVLDRSADAGTLTGTVVKGDLFKFAGDAQSYVATALATAGGNEITVNFEPGLKKATTDGTVVTITGSHTINLGFRRQAFCFVSRPLVVADGLGSIVEAIVDPGSGLTLRLEISRSPKTKTIEWAYDILWGVKTIRRELAMRLLG
jgi:hypothetical protein